MLPCPPGRMGLTGVQVGVSEMPEQDCFVIAVARLAEQGAGTPVAAARLVMLA